MKVLLQAGCLCLSLAAAQAYDERFPSGHGGNWAGQLGGPGNGSEVHIRLIRENGHLGGTFSLPAEGVVDLPLLAVHFDGPLMELRITRSRVFRGIVHEGQATGTLVLHDQDDRVLPMHLVQENSPAWQKQVALREARRLQREQTLAERASRFRLAAAGPAMEHVDRDALARLVEEAAASGTTAMVLTLDGMLVGEWYVDGRARQVEAMSVTKAVLNLAVGRLLHLGRLESVDTPVAAFYREWATGDRQAISVRHLLAHTSGLESPMPTHPIYASDDFVRFALDSPLTHEPGAKFVYNNNATNLLSGLIGRAAGQPLDEFLREDLFALMGISDFGWMRDRAGNPHGMAGLQINALDLAKLGQLVLDRGQWAGQRLIAEDWFEESLRPGSRFDDSAGLLWWLVRDAGEIVAYSARGYLGQYLVVAPERGLVGVRMIESTAEYDAGTDLFIEFEKLVREILPNPVG